MKYSSLKMNEKLSQILKNYIFIIKAEIKQMKGEMSPIELETGLKLMRLQQIFQFNNTIINQVFKHFTVYNPATYLHFCELHNRRLFFKPIILLNITILRSVCDCYVIFTIIKIKALINTISV